MEESFQRELDCLFTMKGKILLYLRENRYRNHPITSKDIQKQFNISKSTVSEHLRSLEQLELIRQIQNGKKKEIETLDLADFFI
ncbi:MAG: winged helix-turn-helix domain-containing protein [Candidatus Thorarchaeota archaeon]